MGMMITYVSWNPEPKVKERTRATRLKTARLKS